MWESKSCHLLFNKRVFSVVVDLALKNLYSFSNYKELLSKLLYWDFVGHRDSQPRNSRHALMLRCLASNDLVAVLGMLVLMNVQLYQPSLAHSLFFCRLRVLWRIFGLGSGCVALVMAVDRYLALTRPFFYQKVSVNFLYLCNICQIKYVPHSED